MKTDHKIWTVRKVSELIFHPSKSDKWENYSLQMNEKREEKETSVVWDQS